MVCGGREQSKGTFPLVYSNCAVPKPFCDSTEIVCLSVYQNVVSDATAEMNVIPMRNLFFILWSSFIVLFKC